MKKLPIGISTLETIIKENYAYVDKTKIAYELVTSGQYYFLSRPRRFGKTLFLDTLRSIFEGKKELFKGLYIYDKWDWNKTYPVLHISFAEGVLSSKQRIKEKIEQIFQNNQDRLKIVYREKSSNPAIYFENLIQKIYEKYQERVVILVDEYDKPILDNIENKELALYAREELKNMYSVIKGTDGYIKFVFITGVSKFSKVSLFSGLNNLEDITLNPRYATIAGYTQHDLETVFAEHLRGQDYEKIRRWYNGYKWLGEAVYNPFDILLFISNNYLYRNYWFSTGTPEFLLKLIEKNNYFLPDFENITKDESMLNSFDVDVIELETLMWQTGYLTIETYEMVLEKTEYKLKIPNLEVQQSLFGLIAEYITKSKDYPKYSGNIIRSLLAKDFDAFKRHLIALYASIPYHLFVHNRMYEKEGYYVSVFYAYMKGLGVEAIAEDVTDRGRIDLPLVFPESIYIMEFKVNGTGSLEQIHAMGYYEKYTNAQKPIYLVGIEFDTTIRNVRNLVWEEKR